MWKHIHSPNLFEVLERDIIIPERAKPPLTGLIKELSLKQYPFDLYVVVGMGSMRLTTVDHEDSYKKPHDTIYLDYRENKYIMSYHKFKAKAIVGSIKADSIMEAVSKIELYLLQIKLSLEEYKITK